MIFFAWAQHPQNPSPTFEPFPLQEVDPSRVGDVYVLAYSCGLKSVEEAEKKRAHYSLLIEVSGGSTDEILHSIANDIPNKVYIFTFHCLPSPTDVIDQLCPGRNVRRIHVNCMTRLEHK
jgi:hypothetical protein